MSNSPEPAIENHVGLGQPQAKRRGKSRMPAGRRIRDVENFSRGNAA
jgi:hypothetical protein